MNDKPLTSVKLAEPTPGQAWALVKLAVDGKLHECHECSRIDILGLERRGLVQRLIPWEISRIQSYPTWIPTEKLKNRFPPLSKWIEVLTQTLGFRQILIDKFSDPTYDQVLNAKAIENWEDLIRTCEKNIVAYLSIGWQSDDVDDFDRLSFRD